MRKALALLGLLACVLCLGVLACSGGSGVVEGDFDGSDPVLKEFRIGTQRITAAGTYNIPLQDIKLLTFILHEKVDPETFGQSVNIKISLYNQDTCVGYDLGRSEMLLYGSFYVSDDQQQVEYRLDTNLGDISFVLWPSLAVFDSSPGETIVVTVAYVTGKNVYDTLFAFSVDAFKIVNTQTEYHGTVGTSGGDFNGSHPMIKEFRLGNTPITAGGTFNVPLYTTDKMTFELTEQVDPVGFVEFLDMKISLHNIDAGQTAILNRNTMLENGEFFVSEDRMTVEYRLDHTMDLLWIGGVPLDFAYPGDAIETTIDFVVGRNLFGGYFAFYQDKFKVIFTKSTP